MHPFRKKFSSEGSPTNNRPPTPTPSIMKYIKQGFATLNPRKKDPLGTLVDSSSALALSIASPACYPTNTILDEPGSSKEVDLEAAYEGAKIGSSSALALSIASPLCDPTDPTPDETGSSKEVAWKTAFEGAKMVIEIANASSDMFLPLKAVVGALSVLMKNCDQTKVNEDQIKEVEEKVQSLCKMLTHPVGDQDSEEKARREILRVKLVKIVTTLGPLAKQHGLVKFLQNADHTKTLNGFVQDLAYAVAYYQTSLLQSVRDDTKRIDGTTDTINKTTNRIDETTERIYETTKKIGESVQNVTGTADHTLLAKLAPVLTAGYKADHHNICLPGTRKSVLGEIMRWAKDPQDKHVFWLNGLAGTGKSTIAQTFSNIASENEILGASFFCSRDYLDRSELRNIFPTLAYQLACKYPAFRRHLVRVIDKDPSVASTSNSLISQLVDLIVGPLSSSNFSCVIVVDALDECIDEEPSSAILSVLSCYVEQLLSVKFFITGRPEPRIRSGFRIPSLQPLTQIFLLHEVKPSNVDDDINLYLKEKLTAISALRSDFDISDPWPCGEDLTILTKKSSGLFIFASTLVRFIESKHHDPNERLQLIITSSDSTTYEGRAGIDLLYTQILVHAFSGVEDATVFTTLRRVLGAVVLAFNPLSQVQIARILGVKTSVITTSLRHLHSVLLVPKDHSKEIRVFHKSFPDFLQERGRCTDPRFFIDSLVHHGDISLDCLKLLKRLKPNHFDLPDFAMNRDVANLPELESATWYACGYWARHVRYSPTTDDYALLLIPSAIEFFEKNAAPWIEVMSLKNQLERVIYSIYDLFDWLGKVNVATSHLRSIAQDYLRFTMHFFLLIQKSALHIYHSALPLSPRSSKSLSGTLPEKTKIRGVYGRPDTWGIVMRTLTSSSRRFTCMTTFGHRIAAACDDGTVGVYDSITGVLRLSLSPTDPVQAIRGSPDGSTLFCAHKTPSITVWDMQTGGLIHTFILERNPEDIAVSLNGHYLACGLSNGPAKVWEVADKIEGTAIWTSSHVSRFCWLEPEEQLAVSTGVSVGIRDVVAGTVIRSFSIRHPVDRMVYSQKFNQLAIMASSLLGSGVTTINPRTGKSSTPYSVCQTLSCFAFSQTSEELACGKKTHGLRLLNLSTLRWSDIEYPHTMISISSLPNGTMAANFVSSGVQLLNLEGVDPASHQSPISALTVHAFDQDRVIAILSTGRDHIILLEPATMAQLLKIPLKTHMTSTDRSAILCASFDNRVAVYSFKEEETESLQLWGFDDKRPKWTVKLGQLTSFGGISPNGARLVTFYDADNQTYICAWDARNGQLEAQLRVDPIHPLGITFDSETQFYSHHDTYRVSYCAPFLVCSPESDDHSRTQHDTFHTFNAISSATPSYPITCYGQLPLIGELQRRHYHVDKTREWVVSGLERICWIPPGYIGSAQSSYCWSGWSLIMVAQDGVLRNFTFGNHSEG